MNRKFLFIITEAVPVSASKLTGEFKTKVSGVLSDGYKEEEVCKRVK